MTTSRKHPETTERQEPVVTYARVPPRRAPARSQNGARPMEIERIEPLLTEVAVPLAAPVRMAPPARTGPVAAPELRAEIFDLDETVAGESDIGAVAKERRPRSAILIVGALVAIAAGIGVIIASFNAAMLTTADRPPASENTSASVAPPAESAEDDVAVDNDEMIADIEARLAALEGKTPPTDEMRQVSPSPGETVSAEAQPAPAPAPAVPPAPRLRPERVATATPAEPQATAPAASGEPAPQAARPAGFGGGDGDFIASIERALADGRAAPGGATADPTLDPGPGLIPPPPADAMDGAALDMLPASDVPVPPEPIPDIGSVQ